MRKLCLYFSLGFLVAMIAPLAKAQSTGPCVYLNTVSTRCVCGGGTIYVTYHTCGVENLELHCYQVGWVYCCQNPVIKYADSTLGDPCNGPKLPTALKGLPQGQQVYMRNCRGLYVASRVERSQPIATGD